MTMKTRFLATIVLAGILSATAALAGEFGSDNGTSFPGLTGFQPQVPVSAFARVGSWFDPSRLQLSTSVSFGSGYYGGSEGLQTTSLSYRFGAPLAMNVSLGRAFGAAAAARGGDSFFLQGFDVAYRPLPSMLFQVHYQDVRSPLQLSPYGYSPYGYYSPYWR